jgi:hypothetical protein
LSEGNVSNEESRRILNMVADGTITAAAGAALFSALSNQSDPELESHVPRAGVPEGEAAGAEFEAVRVGARKSVEVAIYWGVALTILSASAIHSRQSGSGFGLWTSCFALTLIIGVLVTASAAGLGPSRWQYLDIDRANQAAGPRRITPAIPLPLGLASWLLSACSYFIEASKRSMVELVPQVFFVAGKIRESLKLSVDGDGGARVHVYLGKGV